MTSLVTSDTAAVVAAARAERTDDGSTPRPDHGPSSRARLYRLLWRWHFYAGVITAPIMIVAAVTGALYVFVHELQPVMYPQLFLASQPGASSRSLDDLVAAARRAHPEAKIVAAAEPRAVELNATVGLKFADGFRTAMVDPSTAEVVGLFDEPNSFFGVVLAIHRRLLAGPIGRMLVELTAAWGLVLLVTGLYLWWPQRLGRPRLPRRGVWYPRLHGSLLPVLRDWHAVVGFYALITAGLVLFTGLFFTQVFGNAYKRVTNFGGEASGAFAVSPVSEPAGGRDRITLAAALAAAEPLLPGDGPRRVQLPAKPEETFRVTRVDWSNPTWKTSVFVDAYSGKVVHTTGWDDANVMFKVRLSVYPIHTGEIFGPATKILALLTCLALVLLAVTGVWMWWRKRPHGTWGLPPSNAELRIPAWLVASIVALGVLLPAVGLSIVLILLGDRVRDRVGRSIAARRVA